MVRLRAVAAVLAVLISVGQGAALAQVPGPAPVPPSPPALPGVSAGWYLIPSFALTAEFDDNIFATSSNRKSDFISRFSPGLAGGYRSEPFSLLLKGGFDAEVFAEHSELNDATSGWHVGLDAQYLPTRPLTLGLAFSYIETNTTSTLPTAVGLTPAVTAPATVLEFGRVRATFLTMSPSVVYQFTPVTAGMAAYTYVHDTIQGGVSTTLHTTQLRLGHQFTSLDTGILGFRNTVYENEGFPTTVDYAPTVGWIRQLTPVTRLTLEGGPLFTSDGSVGPNVGARLEHEFKVAKVGLGYSRTQGFVLGQPGVVRTETFQGTVSFEPIKSLLVSVGPALTKLHGERTLDTNFYELAASASYPILRWLTARATYRFGYQEQLGAGDIFRNVFNVSLEASYPYRIGQ